jgi:hypothetical protein
MDSIRAIFRESGYIGQGNLALTEHPMTPQACREKLGKSGARYENEQFDKVCGQSTWRRSITRPLKRPNIARPASIN